MSLLEILMDSLDLQRRSGWNLQMGMSCVMHSSMCVDLNDCVKRF